tara:strand:- start:82 stop:699 length:618 start_codon:yes stop_codon:yes gene_type:complete
MNRIEYKIDIEKSKKISFLNFLKKKKAKKLYEGRVVNSIYFDNSKLEMYHDSVEGISPRKKIRLRYYGLEKVSNSTSVNLEIKYSKPSSRAKGTKKEIDFKKLIRFGYFDSQYGICFPVTLVSYLRNYYSVGKYRITLDENIKFESFNFISFQKKTCRTDEIIAEIKNNDLNNMSDLEKEFPQKNTRFSKYCKSVESLSDLRSFK